MKKQIGPTLYVVFSLLFSFGAQSAMGATITFEAKPFPTARSEDELVKQGLREVYKNKASDKKIEEQLLKSKDFQNSVFELLEKQISKNKMIEAQVEEKVLAGRFVKETTVRFKSLVQRPDGHASNDVVARIYEPAVARKFCDYKFPTSIMLHHILNQVEMIEDVAKVSTAGVLAQPGILVVLHMPHYGLRRQGNEEFLNSNLESFRKNMAQLILDVHLLRNYLETRTNVDTNNISLSGFSLGAVMGLTVGAFDQGFARYGSLVGGVDMANILMNRVTNRPESEVAKSLESLKLDEAGIRDELASVEAITWLHRYQSKKLFLLNASRDDIVDYDRNVKPMLRILEEGHNMLEQRINDDGHTPTGGALKKLKEVFLPLIKFIVADSPSYDSVCPLRN